MGQLTNTHFAEDTSLGPLQQGADPSENGSMWQTVQRVTNAGASAVGLPNGLLISSSTDLHPGSALLPTRDAIRRVEQARSASQSIDTQPILIACTNAREAQSVTDDEDAQDRRYLTGVKTIDGFHVYCGDIDASISRALAYAPYADIVCYRASRLDLAEAQRFASAIRAFFPDKQLGIGFSPISYELQRGLDDISRDERLFGLGYGYYFLTLSDSVVFRAFPAAALWAFFDDGAESGDAASLAESQWSRSSEPVLDLRSLHRRRALQNLRSCC
jgi:isocitrate lyase